MESGETQRQHSLGMSQGTPELGDCSGLCFFRGIRTIENDSGQNCKKSQCPDHRKTEWKNWEYLAWKIEHLRKMDSMSMYVKNFQGRLGSSVG